jgi:hypothetical protein
VSKYFFFIFSQLFPPYRYPQSPHCIFRATVG